VHPGYGADERALAGTIGTHDRNDRTLLNLDSDIIERLRISIVHIEIFDAQHQPTASAPR
jgi:hypothetical protein